MNRCVRARELFGPYWDDESTRAEREWLDAHFAQCAGCRAEYEALARTLGAVGSLPRVEPAPDLAERSLASARRAAVAPDVVYVRAGNAWAPAAAAAAAVLVAALWLVPHLLRPHDASMFAGSAPIPEPRLVTVATSATSHPAAPSTGSASGGPAPVTISDTLFDHSEDVDFVLEPVTVHRGRAHTVSRLPQGIQSGRTLISF